MQPNPHLSGEHVLAVSYSARVTQTKPRTRPETQEVLSWRREQLERAGYEHDLAQQISESDADLHQAIRLVRQGCTPQLAAQILL